MHHLHSHHFPFAALVGQDALRTALILNAVNPRIGGVLVRGQKGTAKSTAARGLAEVLPEIEVVSGCPYHCHPTDMRWMCDACAARFEAGEALPRLRRRVPFVTLPLGATEDRIVGTIDVARALASGRAELKPGLLAEANRGILYVDEVNLLDDHLVNLLLDAAAMGRNVVEREGLSAVHPARFILVGTMNPEEGELRPQLLDRFGVAVDVEGISDVDARVEILARLDEFDRDPHALATRFADAQRTLGERVAAASERLEKIRVERGTLASAARRALDAAVDGHRADLTMVKVAVTLCAWHGGDVVTEAHLDEAAALVLPHRLHRRPFEQALRSAPQQASPSAQPEGAESQSRSGNGAVPPPPPSGAARPMPELLVALPKARGDGSRPGTGSRMDAGSRGQRVGSRARRDERDPVDVAATLLTAAVRQGPRRTRPVPAVAGADLRTSRVSGRARRAVCFVVDASGSMGAQRRLDTARAAARRLLEESYQGRHQVALVLAGGRQPRVAVPMTRDVERVEKLVSGARAGGKTPLAGALVLAGSEMQRARAKGFAPALVVITDGRANVPALKGGDAVADTLAAASSIADAGVDALVVDTENDFINLGLGRQLSEHLGGDYLRSSEPDAGAVVDWVRREP